MYIEKLLLNGYTIPKREFEFHIPARRHAASAVLDFFAAPEGLPDLPAEWEEHGILDEFRNFHQPRAVGLVLQINHITAPFPFVFPKASRYL